MELFRTSVNLSEELLSQRKKSVSETDLLANVKAVLDRNEAQREAIRKTISDGESANWNDFDFDLLESDRIFHLEQIRKVCIDYRLRFLPPKYFKGGIPEEAVTRVRLLEKAHGISIEGFRIAAPTKTFQLLQYDDPLLLAPIGNDYFYLVHQWGNDLSASRKWLVWPVRNLMTFTLFSVAISVFIAWMTPETNLSKHVPMAAAIIFLFAFKSVFAVMLYNFFILGKKFNASIWDSEFVNH